jgi:hypothetical protein
MGKLKSEARKGDHRPAIQPCETHVCESNSLPGPIGEIASNSGAVDIGGGFVNGDGCSDG